MDYRSKKSPGVAVLFFLDTSDSAIFGTLRVRGTALGVHRECEGRGPAGVIRLRGACVWSQNL